MNQSSKIEWQGPAFPWPGPDLYWVGKHQIGTFTISFRHAADGRCIFLRHGDEFVGAFATEGAAKRRASLIVKNAARTTT